MHVRTILYVDDDADDQVLLTDAMQNVAPGVRLKCVSDGVQALTLLNEFKEKELLPCLIVLDLNMPFLNGRQTYEKLKLDPALKGIPVAILSSSQKPSDKNDFTKLGLEYFSKPLNLAGMDEIALKLADICANCA